MAATFGWTICSEVGAEGWDQASSNSSGFTALPSGRRSYTGEFDKIGECAYFWSAKEYEVNA